MSNMTKALVALGFASAIFLGNSAPSLARNVHARAPVTEYGADVPWYGNRDASRGAYARVPFGYRNGQGFEGQSYIPPAIRPGVTWDPYGLRWDGAD